MLYYARMDKSRVLDMLCEIVEMPAGTLTETTELEGLENWGSLGVMSFIALADEHCGVLLAPGRIAACRTVGDLLVLIGSTPVGNA